MKSFLLPLHGVGNNVDLTATPGFPTVKRVTEKLRAMAIEEELKELRKKNSEKWAELDADFFKA